MLPGRVFKGKVGLVKKASYAILCKSDKITIKSIYKILERNIFRHAESRRRTPSPARGPATPAPATILTLTRQNKKKVSFWT